MVLGVMDIFVLPYLARPFQIDYRRWNRVISVKLVDRICVLHYLEALEMDRREDYTHYQNASRL